MMPEEDQNNIGNILNMMEQQQPETAIDYSHITKHPYLNKVFCWIQAGNTAQVKRFFDTFPHLLNNFNSPNKWNPFLYAVRYGNFQLMQYFNEKKMNHTTSGILSSYSIVHTAVYSGQASVLEYVLNNMDVSVNPNGCQTSPLKVAMKANNPKMVQLLVAKGAFYVFSDVFNNLCQKQNVDEQNKYWTLQFNRQIPSSMVVQQNIIRDCPIKQTLKYARVKSIIAMKLIAQKTMKNMEVPPKFLNLATILAKDQYLNLLLKMAVNRGQSILNSKANNGAPGQSTQQIG